MEKQLSACFTGHRPSGLPWRYDEEDARCKALKKRLFEAVASARATGHVCFYCGMAMGVDMYAAEAVLALKEHESGVSLHCVVPCKGQERYWSEALKQRYHAILSRADSVTVLSEAYHRACMHQRNRYMVDRSDLVIAVYDAKSKGGTKQTVEYAKRMGTELVFIAPE